MTLDRRAFLRLGLGLAPLAFVACGRHDGWPEGMVAIVWDRDTCTGCGMVISDRRFAVEVRSPDGKVSKFDDIGCASAWLHDQAWNAEAKVWVADSGSKSLRWLDARSAQYVGGKSSPMGYNFAAVALPGPGSLSFADLRQHLRGKGK